MDRYSHAPSRNPPVQPGAWDVCDPCGYLRKNAAGELIEKGAFIIGESDDWDCFAWDKKRRGARQDIDRGAMRIFALPDFRRLTAAPESFRKTSIESEQCAPTIPRRSVR